MVDKDKRFFYVSLLEKYKENILITKQIDDEFYRNRENHKKTYEHLSKEFENKRNQLKKLLEKINFYLTDDKKLDYDGIFDKMKELKTIELIKEEKEEFEIYLNENDEIKRLFESVKENQYFSGFSINKLIRIFEEGEIRYKYDVGPGRTDLNKKGSNEFEKNKKIFGDLILWKEILEYYNNSVEDKNLIIVQNEKKNDWWEDYNKKIPLKILEEEFSIINKNGKLFKMISLDDFILSLEVDVFSNINGYDLEDFRKDIKTKQLLMEIINSINNETILELLETDIVYDYFVLDFNIVNEYGYGSIVEHIIDKYYDIKINDLEITEKEFKLTFSIILELTITTDTYVNSDLNIINGYNVKGRLEFEIISERSEITKEYITDEIINSAYITNFEVIDYLEVESSKKFHFYDE
jgi:hypothetical protein